MNIINLIDGSVEHFIAPVRTEYLDVTMLMITTLFSTWTVIAIWVALIGLALYCAVCRQNALTIIGAMGISVLFSESIKQLFMRERPVAIDIAYGLETSFSFPSGHSAIAAAFFACWGLLFWRRIKNPVLRACIAYGAALAMILIAWSRVYLRVHYATDVLAGMCIGVAAAFIAVSLKSYYNKRR